MCMSCARQFSSHVNHSLALSSFYDELFFDSYQCFFCFLFFGCAVHYRSIAVKIENDTKIVYIYIYNLYCIYNFNIQYFLYIQYIHKYSIKYNVIVYIYN